jgi:hypothetical protein
MNQVLGRVFSRLDMRAPDPAPEHAARRAITFVPAKGARVVVDARRPAGSVEARDSRPMATA